MCVTLTDVEQYALHGFDIYDHLKPSVVKIANRSFFRMCFSFIYSSKYRSYFGLLASWSNSHLFIYFLPNSLAWHGNCMASQGSYLNKIIFQKNIKKKLQNFKYTELTLTTKSFHSSIMFLDSEIELKWSFAGCQ